MTAVDDVDDDGRRFSPTKIGVPDDFARAVPRARLAELIDAQRHLVVVQAPAGTGKTTFVAQWANARRVAGELVAWVALDRLDNDPRSFWSGVADAVIEAAGPDGFADTAMSLVLDDLHEVTDPGVLGDLEHLARHLPPQLRLVLVSRTAPPLALQRLALADAYTEIDTNDLRLDHEEATEMFGLFGIDLDRDQLHTLLELTQGWAAGLRFAVNDHANFRNDDPATMGYLAEEMFDPLPSDLRDFLLATSVAQVVTADLAATLSGRADTVVVLDRLRSENVLVSHVGTQQGHGAPGDQAHVRYHPMLRTFLRARLRADDPERWSSLQRIAGEWHEANDDPLFALCHAIEGGDAEAAERISGAHVLSLIAHGRGDELRETLATVPPAWLARPQVALAAAAVATDAGDIVSTDTLLAGLDHAEGSPPADAHVESLEAAVRLQRARLGGDLSRALRRVVANAEHRSSGSAVDLHALMQQGAALMYLGDHHLARDPLRRANALATTNGQDYARVQCLLLLSVLGGIEGDLRRVSTLGHEALAICQAREWESRPVGAFAHVAIGWPAFVWLDNSTAANCARAAANSPAMRSDPTLYGAAEAFCALATFATADDPASVVARLRSMWDDIGDAIVAPQLPAAVCPYETRMCFQVDNREWAAEALERHHRRLGDSGESWLLHAMHAWHDDRLDAVGVSLARIFADPGACMVHSTMVEAWLLEAERTDRIGRPEDSNRAVSHALSAAREQCIHRPFLSASAPVRATTVRLLQREGLASHRALHPALLATLPGRDVVLTQREQELLRELGWRREMMVEHTIDEIATTLFMSRNTAKSHLRSLYRKLGVSSRTEAVAVAERWGLT